MKNKLIFPLLSLVGILSLTGCHSIDPTPDLNVDVEDHSSITLKTYFPEFGASNKKIREGWLGRAIESYTTYNVEYNQFSSAMDTEVNGLLNTKQPIDMMKVTGTVFNNYVVSGFFTDLTDVIEKYGNRVVKKDGTTFKNLFTKEQWDACSYNGRIYGIPEIGHTPMVNQALIWNTDHLKAVGIVDEEGNAKIPETLQEFTTALELLKEKYSSNKSYYPFGLNGYISVGNPIACAFGVPEQWYEDSDGKLQNMLMSENMHKYLAYMNKLRQGNFIAGDWVSQTEQNCISNFVKQNCSVYVGSYWNVTSVRNSLIQSYTSFPEEMIRTSEKTAYVYGTSKRIICKNDGLVGWNVYLKGDGSNGSPIQKKGIVRSSNQVGYFITVPVACAKRSAYVVDWVSRRNTEECTVLMIAGQEGKHYDYCQANDEGAIKLNKQEDVYVKTYDAFLNDISGMSQFQTSVNMSIAREWWPVAEAGFDAWNVLVVDENGQIEEDRLLLNAFGYHPVLPKFASIDLNAQNHVVTQAQYCINVTTDKFESTYSNAKSTYNSYYYSKCADEINSWYQSQK